MNNKGFTLVELLGVLALIGTIALLVTPKVNNLIKDNRDKGYKEIENRLQEAANKYIIQKYVDRSLESITITKEQLIESKLIEEIYDLKEKDKKCDASVVVSNLNSTPVYTVNLNCENYSSN